MPVWSLTWLNRIGKVAGRASFLDDDGGDANAQNSSGITYI